MSGGEPCKPYFFHSSAFWSCRFFSFSAFYFSFFSFHSYSHFFFHSYSHFFFHSYSLNSHSFYFPFSNSHFLSFCNSHHRPLFYLLLLGASLPSTYRGRIASLTTTPLSHSVPSTHGDAIFKMHFALITAPLRFSFHWRFNFHWRFTAPSRFSWEPTIFQNENLQTVQSGFKPRRRCTSHVLCDSIYIQTIRGRKFRKCSSSSPLARFNRSFQYRFLLLSGISLAALLPSQSQI